MKKAFPVNINGKIYYIDEDAYQLLSNYLTQLRTAFNSAEGSEIVSDIESRISELFDERVDKGAKVISYFDVNSVIEVMGNPSDINDNPDHDENAEIKSDTQTVIGESIVETLAKKRLYRNMNNRIFGGVISGIATYLGWETNILRVLYLTLTVLTYFWPLTLVYLIAWMIIPPANTSRRVLEQQGTPVTVATVSDNVLSSSVPPPYKGGETRTIIVHDDSSSFLSTIFTILGKSLMALLGFTGAVTAMVASGFFIFFLVSLIASWGFGSDTLLHASPFYYTIHPNVACICGMFFSLSFIIPAIALTWAAASVLFNTRGASSTTIISAIVLEVLLVTATIISIIYVNARF